MFSELSGSQDSDAESLQSGRSGSDTYSSVSATTDKSLELTATATATTIVEGTNTVLISSIAISGEYTNMNLQCL